MAFNDEQLNMNSYLRKQNEHSLSTFTDSAADTPAGRDAIQSDLNRLLMWAHMDLMRFNKAKCKDLDLGWGSPKHTSSLENGLRAALEVIKVGLDGA